MVVETRFAFIIHRCLYSNCGASVHAIEKLHPASWSMPVDDRKPNGAVRQPTDIVVCEQGRY